MGISFGLSEVGLVNEREIFVRGCQVELVCLCDKLCHTGFSWAVMSERVCSSARCAL